MNRGHHALLQKVPLFEALGHDALRRLVDGATTRRCPAGASVVREGDPSTFLFVIVSGHLRAASVGDDGREATLSYMGPGEVFGEIAMLDGEPRSVSVIASEASELLVIDRRDFRAILESSPALALRVTEVLARRLRRLTERSADIEFLSIPARLAKKLVELAITHGTSDGIGGTRLTLRLSQRELGELIGATRESVNKSLRLWMENGVVRRVAGRLVLVRLDALRAVYAAEASLVRSAVSDPSRRDVKLGHVG